jgi:hypothetical protein
MTMMTFLSLSLERHLRRLLKRKRSRHNFALWRVYKSSIAIKKDILLRTLTYLICACGPVLSCTRIWSDVLVGFHMKYASFCYPYSRCSVCFCHARLTIARVFWLVIWSLADGHTWAMVSWFMEMRCHTRDHQFTCHLCTSAAENFSGFMLPSLILIWFLVKNLFWVAATPCPVFLWNLWRWSLA